MAAPRNVEIDFELAGSAVRIVLDFPDDEGEEVKTSVVATTEEGLAVVSAQTRVEWREPADEEDTRG